MSQLAGITVRKARTAILKQGPCAMCGSPYAAHRVIDAQMERVAAGDPITDVAWDYGESVRAMVTRWIAYQDLLVTELTSR